MDRLTVENFRCFGAEQTAQLAPLTLLVGENSTGKTSFMALASILWEVVYRGNYLPDFKRLPFDLGTFEDIVHEDDGDSKRGFSGGFKIKDLTCRADFQKGISGVEVVTLRIMDPNRSVTWVRSSSGFITVGVKIGDNTWQTSYKGRSDHSSGMRQELYPDRRWGLFSINDELDKMQPMSETSKITEKEKEAIKTMVLSPYVTVDTEEVVSWPEAMAPVRSQPHRTYNWGDEEISSYLVSLRSDPDRRKQWEVMKHALDHYGKQTGLFKEIDIRLLGKASERDPFQLQFKVHDSDREASMRNIVDVGYGVSQSLPVIVKLIEGNHPLLLLQQPEVHLHPRAQAGLGSILCSIASQNRQILVETHSDYLIDRVRMDVRDQKTDLRPENVSILFFERTGPGVKIHNIRIDTEGNICDAPPSYRQFFMDEVDRDLGF